MTQANTPHQLSVFRILVRTGMLLLMFGFGAVQGKAQELTPKQKKNVEQVANLISKAGLEFKSEDYKASASIIANVQKRLQRLGPDAAGDYRKLLEKQHTRMAKAHEMLSQKGQTLKEVESLPEAEVGAQPAEPNSGAGQGDAASGVSFVKTVAPIINAKCGRCHVAQSRGQFSARDFNTLMDSTTVTEGEPDVSHFIEVIVDGSMPKGGLKVTDAEMVSLKQWIAEGAKFDGEDPNRSLAEFGGPAQPRRNRRDQMATIQKPTGNESVTFGAHVAPVLIENCGRCHMSRNPRGNLDMATFQSLARGGDSGAVFKAGDSKNSLLVQRLRGQGGEVMPPNGEIDGKTIDQIAKWIDEGARFDPADARLSMKAVAAKGTSALMSHPELVESRSKEAERIWNLVMADSKSDNSDSGSFRVIGTPIEGGFGELANKAESLSKTISAHLGTESREHFVRGNATIYMVIRRYDFGEFGKMVLRREFPRGIRSYWDHNGTMAWTTLLKTRDQSVDDLQVELTQQLASLHVADLSPSVPRWFADGLGFCTAKALNRKDEVVASWEKEAGEAVRSMERPDDFLMNRMDVDKAGLVSFLFVSRLKSNTSGFKKLMTGLKEGKNFDKAFADAYGRSPEQLFAGYRRSW